MRRVGDLGSEQFPAVGPRAKVARDPSGSAGLQVALAAWLSQDRQPILQEVATAPMQEKASLPTKNMQGVVGSVALSFSLSSLSDRTCRNLQCCPQERVQTSPRQDTQDQPHVLGKAPAQTDKSTQV